MVLAFLPPIPASFAGCDRLDFGNRALLAAEIFLTRASRDGNQPHEEQRQAQHADMGGYLSGFSFLKINHQFATCPAIIGNFLGIGPNLSLARNA